MKSTENAPESGKYFGSSEFLLCFGGVRGDSFPDDTRCVNPGFCTVC